MGLTFAIALTLVVFAVYAASSFTGQHYDHDDRRKLRGKDRRRARRFRGS